MPDKILKDIYNELQKWEFEVNLFELDEELPLQQLTVKFDADPVSHMVIYFLSDLLKIEPNEDDKAVIDQLKEGQTDLLQLFVRIPLDYSKQTVSDLARLMHMINWSTPLGYFGLNESQGTLYYRYVLECSNEAVDPALIADIVNGMEFYFSERFEILETIATGKQTLNEVLEELKANNQFEAEFPGYDL